VEPLDLKKKVESLGLAGVVILEDEQQAFGIE
jgi:hypothetical protein